MKIAAVTDDGVTISLHFGRAQQYMVCTVEDGQITARELRAKTSHHHTHSAHDHDHHDHSQGEHGESADHKHNQMIAAITDCEVLLARGMGRGAYLALEEAHITPVVTDIASIEEAVNAYLQGSIVNHIEKLH
jgi:predicted Fe-Mo cluster-binding NifX family protein